MIKEILKLPKFNYDVAGEFPKNITPLTICINRRNFDGINAILEYIINER